MEEAIQNQVKNKSEEQSASSVTPSTVVVTTAAPSTGHTALKILVVSLVLIIGWVISLFIIYNKHEKAIAEKDAAMKELENANLELEKALARVETDLDFLEKKQQKATELVESTSVVIDELKVAASTTGNTIKDIKANQEKIKKAVLDLIEDYNRILAAFQENNDATTD